MFVGALTRSVLAILIIFFIPNHVLAGLDDWFKNEVVPTIKGDKPITIDPNRISMSHNDKRILDLELKKAQREGLVSITNTPPLQSVIIPKEIKNITPIEIKIGIEVITYNQTSVSLRYALNEEVFELPPDKGFKHVSKSDEFYLQFDDNLQGKFNVARYFLTGKEYGLLVEEENEFFSIKKYN